MFIPSSLHPQLTLVHGPSQYFLVLKSPVPMISTKLVVINRSAVSANLKYTFGASWFWQPQSPQVRTCLSTYRYPSYLPTYLPTYLPIYLSIYISMGHIPLQRLRAVLNSRGSPGHVPMFGHHLFRHLGPICPVRLYLTCWLIILVLPMKWSTLMSFFKFHS